MKVRARIGAIYLLSLWLVLWIETTASAAEPASAANLVANGDFERGIEQWETTAPKAGKVEIVAGPTGKCVCLSSTDPSRATYAIQAIDLSRAKGQLLRLEATVKAEGVVTGTHDYSKGTMTLGLTTGSETKYIGKSFVGTFDWKRMSGVWPVEDNCVSAKLHLGLHTTMGKVWFDNVVLSVFDVVSTHARPDGVVELVYGDGRAGLRVGGREFVEVKTERPSVPFAPTPAETGRGFVVFQTESPGAVAPGMTPTRDEVVESLGVTATPGQCEPVVFAVFALKPLRSVTVRVSDLTEANGARIGAAAFDIRMGRYIIQRIGYTGGEYHVVPKLLEKCREVPVAPERPQLFWLTLHVPPDARDGDFTGAITIDADGATASLPLHLRVLPFRLVKSKPQMLYFYNNDPKGAEPIFRDMKDHGMTSVILANVKEPLRREGNKVLVDFSKSGRFVQAYRAVGFSDVLVYNPFHDRLATILLELFGSADKYPKVVNYGENICIFKEGEYPDALCDVYRQIVRDIYAHSRQADWPPMLFYPVDEPNSPDDWRLTAARLEYRLTKETVPEARTFCTIYSIPMMERLDPWMTVRACAMDYVARNADGNRAGHEYLRRAGGEIWGIDWPAMWDDFWRAREVVGLLPAKAGVSGMTTWTYYNPPSWKDEFHDLRGKYKTCHLVYRDADGALVPTVTWEGMRAGVTDWQYLLTLEDAVAHAEGPERESAARVLHAALERVPWRDDARDDWGDRQAQETRTIVSEAILKCKGYTSK